MTNLHFKNFIVMLDYITFNHKLYVFAFFIFREKSKLNYYMALLPEGAHAKHFFYKHFIRVLLYFNIQTHHQHIEITLFYII